MISSSSTTSSIKRALGLALGVVLLAGPAVGASQLDDLRAKAQAALERRDPVSAEVMLRAAIKNGAREDELRAHLGEALLAEGDRAEARKVLEGGNFAPGTEALGWRVRGQIALAEGNLRGAANAFDAALRANANDSDLWVAIAALRFSGGEQLQSIEAADRAVALDPKNARALAFRGLLIREQYGLAAALPWFEAALSRDAYYHPALIEYAATLGDSGRYADMLAATRRALAARPGSPQALYLQAVLAARAGRFGLARDMLQRAGPDIAALPGAALLGGALDRSAGRSELAIGTWRQLAADQPLNVTVRRLYGEALLRSGDVQGALDQLRPIALRADADADTLTLVARAFEALGDRDNAAIFLDRAAAGAQGSAAVFASDDGAAAALAAAADDPGDPNYLLGAIRAQLTGGDVVAAVAQARALVAASPGAPAAQLALGDALAVGGRFAEAAPVYARAAALAFDEPTMLRLVDAWGRAGRPRDAAAVLSLYLRQNPQSLTGRRILGHWQATTGDADAAIETLEGVRRTVGNRDAALLADLAIAYAAGDEAPVARRYARAAYRLAPMNAAVCDAYATALAADGDPGAARQLAAKALALAPADPRIAAHVRRLLP